MNFSLFAQVNRLFQFWVPRSWSLRQGRAQMSRWLPFGTALSKTPRPWHPFPSFNKAISWGFGAGLRRTVFLCVCMAMTGCSKPLETRYATTRGASINGIGCFIDLLKKSGRKVDLWPGVSPIMNFQYETIIIFHSTFDPHFGFADHDFHELISAGDNLRVIIVVRDCNVEIDYWRQIRLRPDLPADQIENAKQSYQWALAEFAKLTSSDFEPDTKTGYGVKHVNRSDDPYTKTISYVSNEETKTVNARWPLNRRLVPPDSAEILWQSGDDPLLIKEQSSMGEFLVLASANPLLNGGLVDEGNRQLAAELMQLIPYTDRVAISTSSHWIDHQDLKSPSIVEFFKVHPNGWVFSEAIIALLLFCWWKFPIFGRPRVALNFETARFSRHVEAFGRLLRRTQDTRYARQRIRDWQENARRHSEGQTK